MFSFVFFLLFCVCVRASVCVCVLLHRQKINKGLYSIIVVLSRVYYIKTNSLFVITEINH